MIIKYNRQSSVRYAKRWALSRNPMFYDYENIGGDCTNFASQCIYAGCGVMNYTSEFGWYYINANDKSPSWTGVDFFYDFIVNNKDIGPYGKESELNNLELGDIIQLGNNDGNFYHTLILTSIFRSLSQKFYFVSAHSEDALQKNLYSYNYDKIRCIHIIGANI